MLERYRGPALAKLILMALAVCADSETGECFPSYSTIARDAGCSRRHAMKCVSRLVAEGVIEIVEAGGAAAAGGASGNRSNRYRISHDALGGDLQNTTSHGGGGVPGDTRVVSWASSGGVPGDTRTTKELPEELTPRLTRPFKAADPTASRGEDPPRAPRPSRARRDDPHAEVLESWGLAARGTYADTRRRSALP